MKRAIKEHFDSTSALSRFHRFFFLLAKGRRRGAPARLFRRNNGYWEPAGAQGIDRAAEVEKFVPLPDRLSAKRLATVNYSLPLPPLLGFLAFSRAPSSLLSFIKSPDIVPFYFLVTSTFSYHFTTILGTINDI